MIRKDNNYRYIMGLILIMANLAILGAVDKNKEISFQTGLGVPLVGLNEWYNPTPSLGLQVAFNRSPNSKIIFSFHYQKFMDGSIKDKSFKWLIDYNYYKSPKADAYMTWNDFIVKYQKGIPNMKYSMSDKPFTTFSSLGFGFYNYTQKVSGLIYPGQPKAPLDEDFLMDPISDRRVAWGACAGIGTEFPWSETFKVSFILEYHAVIGYIRAFEDWGLYEVTPLQFLNLGIGVSYLY